MVNFGRDPKDRPRGDNIGAPYLEIGRAMVHVERAMAQVPTKHRRRLQRTADTLRAIQEAIGERI